MFNATKSGINTSGVRKRDGNFRNLASCLGNVGTLGSVEKYKVPSSIFATMRPWEFATTKCGVELGIDARETGSNCWSIPPSGHLSRRDAEMQGVHVILRYLEKVSVLPTETVPTLR